MRARSAILGLGVLTILLMAGAAQSLSGSNTVFSDDIVDGAVTTPDLKAGAVSGSRILGNAVTSDKIKAGSVFGSDLADRAVTSSKVADGSLTAGDVAKATGNQPIDFGSIPAHSCAGFAISVPFEPAGDVIVASPSEEIDNLGKLAISVQDSNSENFIVVNACNVTVNAIDPPAATFHWMIFDN